MEANKEQIEAMLVQLKDLSELMIDLAYSALLHQNREVANYVLELEEKMDKLHTDFELAVLELREKRPSKGLLGLIRLSVATENIADAAAMIADIVYRGARPHRVLEMALEEAEETVLSTRIAENSILADKSLGELGLEDDIGMRVIAVKRLEEWIYNPNDNFILKEGDMIIVRGYAEGKEKLLSLANPQLIY